MAAADTLADAALELTIANLRAAAGQNQEIQALLEELEAELSGIVLQRTDHKPGTKRLEAMLAQAREAIGATYADIQQAHLPGLETIATATGEAMATAWNNAIGVDIFRPLLNATVAKQLVDRPTVLGWPAADWWDGQERATADRFVREMQKGILIGETNDQLARRLRGTKAAGYKDGLLELSRREALSLVRTSAMSVSNAARLETFKESDDLIKAIMWLATLDSRTTLICRALDHKKWSLPDYKPLGHDKAFPGPIAHHGCRSTPTAVTKTWSELSGKKIKTLDNRTLQAAIEQRLRDDGADDVKIAAALARARASMDGQVPENLDMQKWIKRKGADYAEEVLGPGRAALWKDGKITISDLTDQTNRPLSLKELQAFAKTGKAPETLGRAYEPAPGDSKATLRAKAKAAAGNIEKLKAEAAPLTDEQLDLVRIADIYAEAGGSTKLDKKDKMTWMMLSGERKAFFESTVNARQAEIAAERAISAESLIAEARNIEPPARKAPVSKHLSTTDPKLAPHIEHALRQIDRAHDDGGLPDLAITPAKPSVKWVGEYGVNGIEAKHIQIKADAKHPAFTAVHEIGHFLDHKLMGIGSTFGTARPKAEAFFAAVAKTDAFKALQRRVNSPTVKGKKGEVPDHVRYLNEPREIFARAYSQFIATKTNDPLLVRGLKADKRSLFGPLMYWDDDQFGPIAAEIEKLLEVGE